MSARCLLDRVNGVLQSIVRVYSRSCYQCYDVRPSYNSIQYQTVRLASLHALVVCSWCTHFVERTPGGQLQTYDSIMRRLSQSFD